MAGTGSSSCVSLRTLLKVFPVLRARAVRTWNLCIISSVLASGSHCSGRLGIAEEYGNLILREMTFLRGCNAWFSVDICSASVLWWLWKNLHSFYVMADSFPDAVASPFGLNGEVCPADASVAVCSARFTVGNTGLLFYEFQLVELRDEG